MSLMPRQVRLDNGAINWWWLSYSGKSCLQASRKKKIWKCQGSDSRNKKWNLKNGRQVKLLQEQNWNIPCCLCKQKVVSDIE